jgi:hypothetical protein
MTIPLCIMAYIIQAYVVSAVVGLFALSLFGPAIKSLMRGSSASSRRSIGLGVMAIASGFGLFATASCCRELALGSSVNWAIVDLGAAAGYLHYLYSLFFPRFATPGTAIVRRAGVHYDAPTERRAY